jgi:hypothetical protein
MKSAAAGNKHVGFSHTEVFPRIAAIIEGLSSPSQRYVPHREIVDGLILDPDLGPDLERLESRDPQHKDKKWWASNMVQWLSQRVTVGTIPEDYANLERAKIKGSWAYRVANSMSTAEENAEEKRMCDIQAIEAHGGLGVVERLRVEEMSLVATIVFDHILRRWRSNG